MNECEHWLLYSEDRGCARKCILGIFSSYEKAWEYYDSSHDENDKYWNICFIEQWKDEKKLDSQ